MSIALTLTPARRSAAAHAQRLWRDYPRELMAFGLVGFTAGLALAGSAWSTPSLEGVRGAATEASAPPAPPPMIVKALAPDQALTINQEIPLASGPNPAARPFVFKGDAAARTRALDCLTSAVYYEAGSQDADGQRAVAQVVLNRVRHPAFPASVCSVVYQGSTRPTGCQFTFTCDGSLYRHPDALGWSRARQIAEAALSGFVYAPVGFATHYHANYVVPYWAPTLAKNAIVGAHIFYRWAGGWGRPAAFTQRYVGREPNSEGLRFAALAAEAKQAEAPVEELAEAIPGAEVQNAPAGRVNIRFNLATARKASDQAGHSDYVDKFAASDNLRWSLGGGVVDAEEKPLGKPVTKAGTAAAEAGAAIVAGAGAVAASGAPGASEK